jgi:hypothetical protein
VIWFALNNLPTVNRDSGFCNLNFLVATAALYQEAYVLTELKYYPTSDAAWQGLCLLDQGV